jgi:hypothetical protein
MAMTGQDPINARARTLFDRASEGLDQGTAFRLRRVRLEAQQPARPRALPRFAPAATFAAAVLAVALAWWLPKDAGRVEPALATTAATTAELDALVVDEDPELYAWLAEAPVATGNGSPNL